MIQPSRKTCGVWDNLWKTTHSWGVGSRTSIPEEGSRVHKHSSGGKGVGIVKERELVITGPRSNLTQDREDGTQAAIGSKSFCFSHASYLICPQLTQQSTICTRQSMMWHGWCGKKRGWANSKHLSINHPFNLVSVVSSLAREALGLRCEMILHLTHHAQVSNPN